MQGKRRGLVNARDTADAARPQLGLVLACLVARVVMLGRVVLHVFELKANFISHQSPQGAPFSSPKAYWQHCLSILFLLFLIPVSPPPAFNQRAITSCFREHMKGDDWTARVLSHRVELELLNVIVIPNQQVLS